MNIVGVRNAAIIGLLLTSGCSSLWSRESVDKTMVVQRYANELELQKVPGTVEGPWVPNMYQDVEVPGHIDKTNTYYRMPHRTIVEIRPGKYQRAQYADPDGVYRERE